MPAVIEVSSVIQRNNTELTIRISGEIKGNAESRLREISSILDKANAVFKDVNGTGGEDAKPMQRGSSIPSSSDRITDKQIRTLMWLLFRRHIKESDFYRLYGISRMGELGKEKANRIINDLAAKR